MLSQFGALVTFVFSFPFTFHVPPHSQHVTTSAPSQAPVLLLDNNNSVQMRVIDLDNLGKSGFGLQTDRRRGNLKSIVTKDERQIRFYLYTEPGLPGQRFIIGNPQSVINAGFRIGREVKILIHGFQQSYLSDFPQNVKNAYLSDRGKDYNVVCVDWGPLARGSGPLGSILYPLVVENVPKVGDKAADLISFLKSQHFISSFEEVHLIGFSLGAHAAGIAGTVLQRRLFRKVGRITGLDPAGPRYTTTQPFSRRLDPTDAKFVDVVHTNSLRFGYPGQLGHVDFYPNGGRDQPDCSQRPGIENIFTASCSHSRAPMYFTKSITSKEVACRCTSWSEYQRSCKSNCRDPIIFGEHVSHNARGKYFLDVTI